MELTALRQKIIILSNSHNSKPSDQQQKERQKKTKQHFGCKDRQTNLGLA